MEKDTVRKYLKRSEFSDVQADALADIQAQQATKSDFYELRGGFHRLEKTMDVRFAAFEQKMNARFEAFEEKMNARFEAFDQVTNARFDGFERAFESKLDAIGEGWNTNLGKMEARLTWRLIALVTFLGAVMTMVGAFFG